MLETAPLLITYVLLTILLLVISYFVLDKSNDTVNQLFVITPLLFALILVFNIAEFFIQVPPFLLWLPYLLAPLGVMLAGLYIFHGRNVFNQPLISGFTSVYAFFTLLSSVLAQLFLDGNPLLDATNHFAITLPFGVAMIAFFKVSQIAQDQKIKILLLNGGIGLVVAGSLLRSFWWASANEDLFVGLVIILVGVFATLLAFTRLVDNKPAGT